MAAVVIVAVVVGILTLPTPPRGTGGGHPEVEPEIVVDGVVEHGRTLGARNAPVTLQYFSDLGSHNGRVFMFAVLPEIIKKWVRTDRLKVEYRAFGTTAGGSLGAAAQNQQLAALAAGQQNRLWYFVDVFYEDQEPRDVTSRFAEDVAKLTPGLNFDRWRVARKDPRLSREVVGDAAIARRNDIKSAPAFLLGRAGTVMQHLYYRSLRDRQTFVKDMERFFKSDSRRSRADDSA